MEQQPPKKETTALEKHIQTIMLSIITVVIIGAFTKMQSMSETMVRMEERDRSKSEQISTLTTVVTKVQLDLIDVKDRLTKMEVQTKEYYENVK